MGIHDVLGRLVCLTEVLDVGLGVFIAHRLIGKKPQGLMRAYRPGDLLLNIWPNELCRSITVISADQAADRDIMQQTGKYDLLVQILFEGDVCAL